jgi:hypothetical protein
MFKSVVYFVGTLFFALGAVWGLYNRDPRSNNLQFAGIAIILTADHLLA